MHPDPLSISPSYWIQEVGTGPVCWWSLAWFHGSEGREGGRCTGEEAAPRPTLQVAVEAITHIRRLRDALTTKRDDDSASSSFMARAV